MFFFGKNLKPKHKATLCLVALAIIANYFEYTRTPGIFPFAHFMPNGGIEFNSTKIILSFGIFVKMLVLCIFRKF